MTELLALLVIVVAMPLNWLTAALLWHLSHLSPAIRVLRERAITATAMAVIVTIFALVFVNNDLVPPPIDFESTKFVTRGTLLVLSIVPAVYWLIIYKRTRDKK